MRLARIAALALLFIVPASPRAEVPDSPPEALRTLATHVVTGEVVAVYTRLETDANWKTTHYVAEVSVASLEKGRGPSDEVPLYVRYWSREYRGRTPPADTNGHRGLPQPGRSYRIYLARNSRDGFRETTDGGYNVVGPNGFEEL